MTAIRWPIDIHVQQKTKTDVGKKTGKTEDGVPDAGNNIMYKNDYCRHMAILPEEMHIYGLLLEDMLSLQIS